MNIESIIVGPIQVNCFIITCPVSNQSAIVDPGDDAENILKTIRSKSLDLKYILLTHGHFDHIGAVSEVKSATGAEIFMHKADTFLVQGAALQAQAFGLPAPDTFVIDSFIDDGDNISVGEFNASVLTTPGHSPGGVCFKFENDIFAGDTLFYGGIGRTDLPGGDYRQLIASIKNKLFVLPDSMRVFCGHGPSTTIRREKKYNPFIQ
ncbi:MBL fold metallo-hydrolase [candidate division KSB1 bacterium]|nr:MBL fold metallo-hydrolase [candidate division KSB1 bacterium]RQV99790.1 MAG: MBL fold metallo-hydrolase [candidate division KSB1 bacterium]